MHLVIDVKSIGMKVYSKTIYVLHLTLTIDYGIETAEQFEDAYQGSYLDGQEFCQVMVADLGYLDQSNLPGFITNHINWDDMWECELRHDYFILDGKRPVDKRFFSKYF